MFQDLELTWNGESKTLKPTMDLLRYLENRNVGPHLMAYNRSKGMVAPAIYSDFVASVLAYAGFSVSIDDVFEEAHSDEQALLKLQQTVDAFISAMMPTFQMKGGSPAKKKAVTRKKATSKAQ